MSSAFDKIKSFVNLKTFEETQQQKETPFDDDLSSDGNEDHIIRPDTPFDSMLKAEQVLFGNEVEIDKETYKEENVLLRMLEDIQKQTAEILEKETKTQNTVYLSDKDMKKLETIQKKNLNERLEQLKKEIENKNEENENDRKNFKHVKYILLGINTACIALGVFAFIYYRNHSSAEKIIEKMESKTFRATNIGNNNWMFRSHPRGSLPQNIILAEK